MHCAACVGRVEDALRGVPGVASAHVNLATREARVTAQTGVPADALMQAASSAGYGLHPIAAEPQRAASERQALEEREVARLRRLVLVAAVLSAPVFVIQMAGIQFPGRDLVLLVLTAPVVLGCGRSFFVNGWKAVRRHNPDMNTLVALGVGAAFASSVVATLAPRFVAGVPHGTHVQFESAAVIVTLVLLGRFLESRARRRTSLAVEKLVGLSAPTARRIVAGVETDVPVDQLVVGDEFVVRPGERIPTDGVVIDGGSSVDESAISGESMPRRKDPGAELIGGTVNGAGALRARATRVGADTLWRRIVSLVEEAQGSRAPIADLADAISRRFVPGVLVVAVATFAAWSWFGPEPRWLHAYSAAIAVLVIACPCALGLATPMALVVGIGCGARHGILFRGGDSLQASAGIDTVLFDKTGTLTVGRPQVTDVIPVAPWTEDSLLRLAGAAERLSEHPIAGAIVAAASARFGELQDGTAFESIPGAGIEVTLDGKRVLVGGASLLQPLGIEVGRLGPDVARLTSQARSLAFVVIERALVGVIGVADAVAPTAEGAVRELSARGLRLALVSGDDSGAARAIGEAVGISTIHAGVRPQGKVDVVRSHQAQGHRVAMVGDGVNDAPALALADVGFAVASGTDVALEAAGVTLLGGDLGRVADALDLAQRTFRTIRQNLFFAFVYNAFGIPLAAGVLHPITGWQMDPMLAGVAMALSSVSVVTNSLRLARWRPDRGGASSGVASAASQASVTPSNRGHS